MENVNKRARTIERIGAVLQQTANLNRIQDVGSFQRILANWSTICADLKENIGHPTHFKDGQLTIEVNLAKDTSHDELSGLKRRMSPILKRRLRPLGVRDIQYTYQQTATAYVERGQEISTQATQRTTDIKDDDLRQAMAALLTAFENASKKS